METVDLLQCNESGPHHPEFVEGTSNYVAPEYSEQRRTCIILSLNVPADKPELTTMRRLIRVYTVATHPTMV